jgi:Rod binding domain-containing protein
MTVISPLNTISALPIGGPASQTDWLMREANSAHTQNAKIEKSARDFESILLSNWLQQAEQSFASVPGADEDEDGDSGKEQFQGMAMQSLGASMTAAGGIGIAKMISTQLHKAEDARVTKAEKSNQNPAK